MAFEIKKAEQVVKPLKLALQGPAGSGKTDGAIATAIRMGFDIDAAVNAATFTCVKKNSCGAV